MQRACRQGGTARHAVRSRSCSTCHVLPRHPAAAQCAPDQSELGRGCHLRDRAAASRSRQGVQVRTPRQDDPRSARPQDEV